jgi:hypothetical protein
VSLSQNLSSKHFAVLADYYKNLLLLEEVVTLERERKDKEASHETSSNTIDNAKTLLKALDELQSEVLALIRTKVRGVTARDKYAELAQNQDAQNQELPNPPNSNN